MRCRSRFGTAEGVARCSHQRRHGHAHHGLAGRYVFVWTDDEALLGPLKRWARERLLSYRPGEALPTDLLTTLAVLIRHGRRCAPWLRMRWERWTVLPDDRLRDPTRKVSAIVRDVKPDTVTLVCRTDEMVYRECYAPRFEWPTIERVPREALGRWWRQ